MPQQKGFKRAQKVVVRQRKLAFKAIKANTRRVIRRAEVALKEPQSAEKAE